MPTNLNHVLLRKYVHYLFKSWLLIDFVNLHVFPDDVVSGIYVWVM